LDPVVLRQSIVFAQLCASGAELTSVSAGWLATPFEQARSIESLDRSIGVQTPDSV
jgi:hypothetical protein